MAVLIGESARQSGDLGSAHPGIPVAPQPEHEQDAQEDMLGQKQQHGAGEQGGAAEGKHEHKIGNDLVLPALHGCWSVDSKSIHTTTHSGVG